MTFAEIGEVLLLKLVEQPSLVFGDDAVADAREDDRVAVSWRRRASVNTTMINRLVWTTA